MKYLDYILIALLWIIVLVNGPDVIAMEQQTIREIGWAEQVLAFISNHPEATVWGLGYIFNAPIAFLVIQIIKRFIPTKINRRMHDNEVRGIALVVSVCLSLFAWQMIIPESSWRLAVFHSVIIAIIYIVSIKKWMQWTKSNQPELHKSLRYDRRGRPRDEDITERPK